MPYLFGKNWTREQLEKYVCSPWQIGGVRHMRFVEGPESGTDVVQFDTGTGLNFNVLPSRGLDIASAKFQGASLSYDSPAGEVHPSFYDPQGLGWLKSFFGGLVTTCGLTWAGAPCVDQGEPLGLHGRYSHTPARNLKIGDEWILDERRMWVSGDIREASIFGPNMLLKRTVSTEVGSYSITIEDIVRNEGFKTTPLMLLYHINIGFPVVDENAELIANSKVTPRDEASAMGMNDYFHFNEPFATFKEQLFYHDIIHDKNGYCHVALVNPAFGGGLGIGIYLRYRQNELSRFAQWKMMSAGTYVCGLEPGNCSVQGRAHDREEGTLVQLDPGEERAFFVEITVLQDKTDIDKIRKVIMGKASANEDIPVTDTLGPISKEI